MAKHAGQLILACGIALVLCVLVSKTISAGERANPSWQPVLTSPASVAQTGLAAPLSQRGGPFVWIRAASGAEIPFKTQNGETIDGVPPREFNIPWLVLYRNGVLNPDADERTLLVSIENITLPPMETCAATITVKTQHGDPDLGGNAVQPSAPQITVWQESRPLSCYPDRWTVTRVDFSHEFTSTITVMSGTQHVTIPTPTDYFWVDIQVTATGVGDWPREYAFLMENQIRVPLDAQNELLVRYYDMAPIGHKDNWGGAPGTNWLLRQDVRPYVEGEFVQMVREAFNAMVSDWGFGPIHPQWRDWAKGWADNRSNRGEREQQHSRLP